MPPDIPPWLTAGDADLFRSGSFSDVLVTCADREWKLHRSILCPRSEWFRKCLTNDTKEANSGVVTITDTDAEVLNRFLEFLYTSEVSEFKKLPRAHLQSLAFIRVADFFLHPEAIEYGLQELRRTLASYVLEIQTRARHKASSDIEDKDMKLMTHKTSNEFWAGVKQAFEPSQYSEEVTQTLHQAYSALVIESFGLLLTTDSFLTHLSQYPLYAVSLLHHGITMILHTSFLPPGKMVNSFREGATECPECGIDVLAKRQLGWYYMPVELNSIGEVSDIDGFSDLFFCTKCYPNVVSEFKARESSNFLSYSLMKKDWVKKSKK